MMAEKKKSSKKKLVLIVLLCIFVLMIVGWWAFYVRMYNDNFNISAKSYEPLMLRVENLDHERWSHRLDKELFARFLEFYEMAVRRDFETCLGETVLQVIDSEI